MYVRIVNAVVIVSPDTLPDTNNYIREIVKYYTVIFYNKKKNGKKLYKKNSSD